MPATNPFLVKFASSIIVVLPCHDRVIFLIVREFGVR